MASALPNHRLSKSKFLNWIKAALAVHFTKEEIEPVVQDELVQFQRKCLQTICTTNGLPAGSICTTCYTENVIVCPTDRICNAKRGKCKYHRSNVTQYRPSGCPNKICHHMKSEIQNAHRFHDPSYKNTDATKWCNNAWEIAKCYLPPDGYKNVSCAAETDFNGIVSVIINHKDFEAKIKDDLSKKQNIFDKGRDVGRAVRHSPNLEVEDTVLSQYFTILNDMLTDPGFATMNKSSHKAIQKLTKLQTGDLIIGLDVVRQVLEDEGKAIQEQIRNEIDEYKYNTEKQKKELIDIVNLKVKDIEDKGNITLTQLNDTLKSCVDTFDARVQKAFQEIENHTEKGKKMLETAANDGVKQITKEAENVIKEVQKAVEQTPNNEVNANMSEETYQKRKEELKEHLKDFYKWNHSKVLLSPLFEEKDTPLAYFYIRPELSVKTLQDMFKTKGVTNREIYLKADAGLGKTTFSKYLATSWYQAHCPDEKDLHSFEKNDIDCMRDFDFVFLVLLRESNTLCSVDELIFELIISYLDNSNSFTEDYLQELLRREKCLVILDGLDEWTHPKGQCNGVPRSVPHRKVRTNCTVLTTTRPWKIGDLNLSSNKQGKTVELTKLSYNSAVILIQRTLLRLKSLPHNMSIEIDDATLVKEIFKSRVGHLAYVPLLLMYMICLRCEGFNIGNSKSELYVKIIELLLERTTQKYEYISQTRYSCGSPKFFDEHDICKKYFPLLINLGELAYHTLSNETKENTLVFDRSVTEKYISPEDMKFTFHSGILSQSTTTKLTKKVSKVTFSHKTVQEFFAAIFISSQSDAHNFVLKKCRNIQDILDMSKICEFISEINVDRMCTISNDLMSVVNADKGACSYRTRKGDQYSYNPLYDIQKLFIACLEEMSENENSQLYLQDFFIDKYTENSKQLQRLLKQNKGNIKSLFINTINTSSSLRGIIDLFSLTDLSHIQKLNYLGEMKKEAEIHRILFPSLQYVTLTGGVWTNAEENLSINLARVRNIQYLYIKDFALSYKIMETFYNFISGQKSMKELTLEDLDCKEYSRQDCKILNLDLSQQSTLRRLVLQWLPGRLKLNISTPSLLDVTLNNINLDESIL